jgi:phosphoenolpyruvate carboxylase
MLLELTGTPSADGRVSGRTALDSHPRKIVLPLVIIQHYALQCLNNTNDEELIGIYNKLVIRTVYGIVNAGRNLA